MPGGGVGWGGRLPYVEVPDAVHPLRLMAALANPPGPERHVVVVHQHPAAPVIEENRCERVVIREKEILVNSPKRRDHGADTFSQEFHKGYRVNAFNTIQNIGLTNQVKVWTPRNGETTEPTPGEAGGNAATHLSL